MQNLAPLGKPGHGNSLWFMLKRCTILSCDTMDQKTPPFSLKNSGQVYVIVHEHLSETNLLVLWLLEICGL